jgi:hypothetical protein
MPNAHAKWEKPSPETIALFEKLVPKEAERRQMFGFPCAFVNGHMFLWVHRNRITVRLPEAIRAQLITSKTAEPVDPSGRRMREYVMLDGEVANGDRGGSIVEEAFVFAASLPPKIKKPRRKIL